MPNQDASFVPVDIIEVDPDQFLGADTGVEEKEQQRFVAAAGEPRSVQRLKERGDLLGRERRSYHQRATDQRDPREDVFLDKVHAFEPGEAGLHLTVATVLVAGRRPSLPKRAEKLVYVRDRVLAG